MTPNPRVLVLAVAAALTAVAAPVFAQAAGVSRPSNGLFDAGNSDPNARQRLDVTMSLAAARDSDVSEEASAAVNQLLGQQPTAHANMFVGAADYDWRGRHVQVRANAGSTLRHDRLSGDISSLGHNALAGFTARLPRRTSLLVNQTAAYSPSYLYTLLLPAAATGATGSVEAPPATAPDSPANDFVSYVYSSQVTLTHNYTRRSRFWAIAERTRTDYQGTAASQPELAWHGMTGLVAYGVGRNTTATARYRYRAGNFGEGGGATIAGITTEQGVEIGLSHSRPFSATRRVTFDLGIGSSVVTPPDPPEGMSPFDRSYPVIGQLGIAYLFGQSWQTSAMYHRRVDYVPGFTAPVSTDGFTARLDGLITRRVDGLVSAAYSSGRPTTNRSGPTFDTYTGTARLRYALAPAVAAYAEYVYYFYDFRGSAQLAPGMPELLERHGVRAGLTLRVPALGR